MKVKLIVVIVASALFINSASAGPIGFTKRHPILSMGAVAAGALYLHSKNKKKNCVQEQGLDGPMETVCSPEIDNIQPVEKSNSAAKILRKNLNAERATMGMPPDPDDCEAHHIVPESDSRKGVSEQASLAREAIDGCVDINSAENGIFLPGPKNKSGGCDGDQYHRSIHTKIYYDKIASRLVDARNNLGCDGVRQELSIIKNEMMGL